MNETKKQSTESRHGVHYHTLANGLRVVHIERPKSLVGWCGLAIGAGSRDDGKGKHGLAHFVEHTLFKGTTHRRSWHIINRMEQVGGELNAYTTKEETMLYSVYPAKHLSRAMELISDLVCNSIFPAPELERELGVVLEEAASYRDNPADAVYDDFEDMIFDRHALGHNILGNEHDLHTLSSNDCLDYLRRLFVPQNMVLFVVGPDKPHRVFRLAERFFDAHGGTLQRIEPRLTPPVLSAQREHVDIDTHQSHVLLGARIPGMHHDDRYAFFLLNNLLAGPGMNSLLNVQLRERRGLVYIVESSVVSLSDCGLLEIYFGCDHADVNRSLRIIERTLRELAETRIEARRLERIKKQYCGQLLVGSDNVEALAIGAGRSVLNYGVVGTLSDAIEHVNAITPNDIRRAAEALNQCSMLAFG